MNFVVVQGRVRSEPVRREASDGTLLVSFDLRIEESPSRHVPVTWRGAPSSEPTGIEEGRLLTVIGSVDRRFYRRGGTTVSRTDVRADRIVRGAGKRALTALSEAWVAISPTC